MNERSFIVKCGRSRLDAAAAQWPAGTVIAAKSGAELLRKFPPAQRYLVGASGGRDSVALLHWLRSCGYQRLIVCHFDHRLRGRSSAADARFVSRMAEREELQVELGSSDVRERAAAEKLSVETAARAARYEFFAKVARRRRCRTIFLGHHADDLVETFLINLFRGSGTAGQRGIQPIATRTVEQVQLTILRPLLSVWRSEIDEYVAEHRLRFREDATNQQLQSLRNRVRHRVIPQLEKQFGRTIRQAVHRAATIAADEDAFLNDQLPVLGDRAPVKSLRQLPVALQRRAITRWLRSHSIADVGFEMVEAVRALLHNEAPARVNLTGGRHARRRAGELFIE
jgi:tRNA(Ile)-lysidine synthase